MTSLGSGIVGGEFTFKPIQVGHLGRISIMVCEPMMREVDGLEVGNDGPCSRIGVIHVVLSLSVWIIIAMSLFDFVSCIVVCAERMSVFLEAHSPSRRPPFYLKRHGIVQLQLRSRSSSVCPWKKMNQNQRHTE